jgi:hypothetical protein
LFALLIQPGPSSASPSSSESKRARVLQPSAQTSTNEATPSLLTAINQAKLTAPDGAEYDNFGYSVAVAGDTAVVGAPQAFTPGAGSAYVFVRSGTTWSQQAKLTASDGAPEDAFGLSVAVAGDTAVVGARYDDTSAGTDAGSAYVFVRSGTTWTEQAKLTASDGAAGDGFGFSVALAGNTAVVGAHFDDTSAGTDAGSAYVFVRSGTTWSQQAKLTASDGAAGDGFGWSVALSGDTAVVGAFTDDPPVGFDSGSAYVFVRSTTAWTEQAKLTASDGATSDMFGISVAVAVNTVVVGAWADDTPAGTDTGSAYVFVRSGTAWSQQAKLIASDGAENDHLGISVAVRGSVAVVGAFFDDTQAGSDAGSAYVFVRSGTTWTQRAKATAPDAASLDQYGYSVALTRRAAVVGAVADDSPAGTDVGSAWVYWI